MIVSGQFGFFVLIGPEDRTPVGPGFNPGPLLSPQVSSSGYYHGRWFSGNPRGDMVLHVWRIIAVANACGLRHTFLPDHSGGYFLLVAARICFARG